MHAAQFDRFGGPGVLQIVELQGLMDPELPQTLSFGAEAVAYGDGLPERVRAVAPEGVDAVVDVAGNGVLPELIEPTGYPDRVVTVADFRGATEHGVVFSRGDSGRALYILGQIGDLVGAGRFDLPQIRTFPLSDIAEAHRVGEQGHSRTKARPHRRPARPMTRRKRADFSTPVAL